MSPSLLRSALAVVLGTVMCLLTSAHPGPEHEIEELSEQIRVQGRTSDLLLRRAVEYRVLGKVAEAANDLELALWLDDTSAAVQRELSQAYFSLGKTNEALALASRAADSPVDPVERASLLVVRSAILRARGEHQRALSDVHEAIQLHRSNVEWYLIRSQLQAVLMRSNARVKGLEEGLRETGSGLLMSEWIDALIDDSQYARASERIEKELQETRWKSTWLIRRAKVRIATGQVQAGRDDLLAAIEELNHRLGASAADALVLADRGHAHELLGNKEEARHDYRAARDKGLTDEWLLERLRALRDSALEHE